MGKLRQADAAPSQTTPLPSGDPLMAAVRARDAGRARAAARGLDANARRQAYAELAPFAALDAAARPIFSAHTVKVLEALHRLEVADPAADGVYLDALLAYLVPLRRELQVRRTAAVARKFLRDGRPPHGLY